MINSEHNTEASSEMFESISSEVFERFDSGDSDYSKELLDDICTTPLGRLLKLISSLPEIRDEKVSFVRRQISQGEYNLNDNLDTAIDRVLEELIME